MKCSHGIETIALTDVCTDGMCLLASAYLKHDKPLSPRILEPSPGVREIKTPWLCAGCAKPVQTYFGDEMKLPCAYCDRMAQTSVRVPDGVGGEDFRGGMAKFLSIVFDRVPHVEADLVTWRPSPCIDATVNTELTAALRAEGLGGCFVKPPHVHGHFVLKEGETLSDPCSSGCTWERARGDGFFATDRAAPGRYTVTTPVPGDRVAVMPYFEMKPEFFAVPLNEAVKKYQEIMVKFTPGAQAGTFVGPGVASGLAMAAEQEMIAAASDRLHFASLKCYADGCTTCGIKALTAGPAYYFGTPSGFIARDATAADVRGIRARQETPDAIAGCRLGCACDQHRPPRESWVPSVDDFDLLPDA